MAGCLNPDTELPDKLRLDAILHELSNSLMISLDLSAIKSRGWVIKIEWKLNFKNLKITWRTNNRWIGLEYWLCLLRFRGLLIFSLVFLLLDVSTLIHVNWFKGWILEHLGLVVERNVQLKNRKSCYRFDFNSESDNLFVINRIL